MFERLPQKLLCRPSERAHRLRSATLRSGRASSLAEDFEINTVDYELGDRIVFSLYDHDIAKSDNFLGKHELSCAEWGYPGGPDACACDVASSIDSSGHGPFAEQGTTPDVRRMCVCVCVCQVC